MRIIIKRKDTIFFQVSLQYCRADVRTDVQAIGRELLMFVCVIYCKDVGNDTFNCVIALNIYNIFYWNMTGEL